MNLPVTDHNDRSHKNDANTLSWSMLLSGQVLHRLIEAIKVTCFGISRRPCAKHRPIKRKTTYQLLLIGLFHKLISVQDIGHDMLHLHVAQQLSSIKGSAPVCYLSYQQQWCWAEQILWHFSKQNIFLNKRFTQVTNKGREAWHTIFAT